MLLVMGITGKVGGATAEHLLAGRQGSTRARPQSREGVKLGEPGRGTG